MVADHARCEQIEARICQLRSIARDEPGCSGSSRAKRSHPTLSAISRRPAQSRTPIFALNRINPAMFAISGAITNRVDMRVAAIRFISQKSRIRPGNSNVADQAMPVPRFCQSGARPSMNALVPARPIAAVAAMIATQGANACPASLAARTAQQLPAATKAAARTSATNAHPDPKEPGSSIGKMHNVPATAASAAIRSRFPRASRFGSMCGSRTTVNTGTREKMATRVKSETWELAKWTKAAGSTKRPRPDMAHILAVEPHGHRSPRANVRTVAKIAPKENVKASSRNTCRGDWLGADCGNKSARRAPSAQSKESRSRPAIGTILFFVRRFRPTVISR